MNYNDQRKSSSEKDFLSRSLLENSKSRICYLDLREKYFSEEIKARDLAREEAKRFDSLEEGDMMEKNNDLQKVVANSTSSPAPVKLTPQEKAKQKALLQKQKEKEKARLAREKEKQKEREKLAREKEKQKEKERLAKERAKQKEKERLLKEKERQKEKERLAKERAKQKELEKKEKEKQKELEKKEASSLNKAAKSISFETDNVLEVKNDPVLEDVLVNDETVEGVVTVEDVVIEEVVDNVELTEEIVEEDVAYTELTEEEVAEETVETTEESYEEEVQEEKTTPKSLEDLLAMKKKDDNKQTEIPSDNLAKLRQRMEANRKLEQGIVENNTKKAQAIEETKNKFKSMSYDEYEEDNDDLYQQIEELERKIAELEEENNNLTDEINDYENEKEKLLKDKEKEIEAIHLSYVDEISDLRNEIDTLENDLNKKEQLSDTGEIEKLKAIINEQDQVIESLKKENASLLDKLNKAEEEISDLEDQIDDLEDELESLNDSETENKDNADLLKEIEELKAVVDKLDKLVDDKDEELANKEELIETLNDALNAEKENGLLLVNKLDKSDAEEVVALEEKVNELEKANEELESTNKELTDKVAELEEKINKLEKANETTNNKYLQATKKLSTANNKVKKLEKDNQGKQEEIVALTNSLLEKQDDEELKKQCEVLEKEIADKDLVIEDLTKANSELKELVDKIEETEEVVIADESLNEVSLEELTEKIADLKKQIEEKDDKLSEINTRLDDLTEEDIRNPEFTRAILNIRERKQEVINKMASDKNTYEVQIKRNQELLDEAYEKYSAVKEKRDELNKQYQNVGDSTSLRREEYLAKSQKITFEEEAIVRALNEHKANEELINEKFNNAINESEQLIKELDRQEVEIIEFYLNKLKEDYSNNNEDYKEYEKQKKDLMRQLNELNIIHLQMQVALEQSRSLVRDSDNELLLEDDSVESTILLLKADIAHLNNEYNTLVEKIDLIKNHLDKRSKSEKVLRITDEDIVKYNVVITDLDALTVRYQTNLEVVVILKQDLETLNSKLQSESVELEKLQAEVNESNLEEIKVKEQNISDINKEIDVLNNKLEYVEIVQNDLIEKINYNKEEKVILEENEKVNYYISLLKSMEQLKVKNIEFRVRANDIKELLETKQAELTSLENEDKGE